MNVARAYAAPTDDANIIARVPGQYLAQALCKLPNAEIAAAAFVDATIEGPTLGSCASLGTACRARKAKCGIGSGRLNWSCWCRRERDEGQVSLHA